MPLVHVKKLRLLTSSNIQLKSHIVFIDIYSNQDLNEICILVYMSLNSLVIIGSLLSRSFFFFLLQYSCWRNGSFISIDFPSLNFAVVFSWFYLTSCSVSCISCSLVCRSGGLTIVFWQDYSLDAILNSYQEAHIWLSVSLFVMLLLITGFRCCQPYPSIINPP